MWKDIIKKDDACSHCNAIMSENEKRIHGDKCTMCNAAFGIAERTGQPVQDTYRGFKTYRDNNYTGSPVRKAPFNIGQRQQDYRNANEQARKRYLENLPAKMKGQFDNAVDESIREYPNIRQYEVKMPQNLLNGLNEAIKAGVKQAEIEDLFAKEYGVSKVKVDMDNRRVIFYR